ncbi:MAG: hypothetical protein ACXVUE_20340 [Solirubrobacteraceae bacterium]
MAIATGRESKEIRYRRAVGIGVAIVLVSCGIALGIVPREMTSVVNALVTAAVPW